MSLIERYRIGGCKLIWNEIRAIKASELEGATRDQVWQVACETMRRTKWNLELIHGRLKNLGYEFYDYPRQRALTAIEALPPVALCDTVPEIEAKIGRLPLALKAWFEFVGGVNFMGRFPEPEIFGSCRYLDPVVLICANDLLQEVKFEEENGSDLTGFVPTIAPDKYIKNGEGGGPYFAELREPGADFLLKLDCDWWFTDYLRHVFNWGGFPGISAAVPNNAARSTVDFLKADLLEI